MDTSGKIGLPSLARVMGVGRQQQGMLLRGIPTLSENGPYTNDIPPSIYDYGDIIIKTR